MNILVVMYVLSRMSVAYGLAMTVPFVISLFTGEGGAPALACGAVISICIGSVMGHVSKNRVDTLTVQEGIAITALSWIMATFLGMIPYVIGGYLGILDGVVECISGLSGTGATVIPDVTVLPESILLWRSMTHWLGGLGIIVILSPYSHNSARESCTCSTRKAPDLHRIAWCRVSRRWPKRYLQYTLS